MYFERIKELREENDLTQQTIADILGVSRSTYASWEVNINTIPLDNFNSLCNYFNVSMDYIVTGARDSYITEKIEELDKIEIGKRLKMIRKKMKYTQNDLAKTLGTSTSLISAYENGTSLITTLFLFEISKLTNTSIDWICGRTFYSNEDNYKSVYKLIGENIARIRKKKNITEKQLANLIHCNNDLIYNVEKHGAPCSVEFLYAISKKLNIEMNEFFKETNK